MKSNEIFPVVESFVSINGEGAKSGQLALFIRFKGCNLDCSYCDTKWANVPDAAFENKSADQLCELANSSGVLNITLTGGEPLLQPGIYNLIEKMLAETNCEIEVETNGSLSIKPWDNHRPRLSFTLDYKLPGSGMEDNMNLENYSYLMDNDTVKFVCSDEEDLHTARKIIDKYDLSHHCRVYLSPVYGRIEPEKMVEFMKENQMNGVNLQLQMHKFIWAPDRRGV